MEPWGDPGRCATCNTLWEWVRPGKSQPNCDCHLKCHKCGGMHEYFHDHWNQHPDYPKCGGYFCRKCGPFV
jgi:hypothetical protein